MIPIAAEAPRCPSCRVELDCVHARAPPGRVLPRAGDFDVCAHCPAVLRFTGEGFQLRIATPAEVEALAAAGELAPRDADLLRQCFALRAMRRGGAS